MVLKITDEVVSESTTMQADDTLKFTIGANENWVFEIYLSATANDNTHDIDVNFTIPSGTIRWGGIGVDSSEAALTDVNARFTSTTGTTELTFGCVTGTSSTILIKGAVFGGVTGGTVQLNWAMNVNSSGSGDTTTVQSGSYLKATKVSP